MELILLLAFGAAGLLILSNDSDEDDVDEPEVDETDGDETSPPQDEPVEPADLVQVTNAEGEDLPVDALISPAPEPNPGGTIDYDLVLNAPEEAHEIDVTSDADTTFLVAMNEHTTSVSAGLSTEIREEEPAVVETVTDSGVALTTFDYIGAADVTITIHPEDLEGTQQTYTLHNPDSSLHFDLDPSLNGHLHIVWYGEEGGGGSAGADYVERESRFIVYTDENTPTLSEADLALLADYGLETNDEDEFSGIVLAEVSLGEDVSGGGIDNAGREDPGTEFEIIGLNRTPLISVGGPTPNNTPETPGGPNEVF